MNILLLIFSLSTVKGIYIEEFSLKPGVKDNFVETYKSLNRKNRIITSDFILNTAINIYDSSLILIEKNKIIPLLKDILNGLIPVSYGISQEYFKIALELLNDSKGNTEIERREIALVDSSDGFHKSPLLGIDLDYSQFKVRGHYTHSPKLSSYFKSMMWLSSIKLPLEKENFLKLAQSETRALINANVINLYDSLSSMISDLVGPPDGINPLILKKYLNSPAVLDSLKKYTPRIEPKGGQKLYFSFFPQRFIFDSYVFQRLTFDYVEHFTGKKPVFTSGLTDEGIQRVFPRSLDFFAVLGSNYALNILKKGGDTDYENYFEMFNRLKDSLEIDTSIVYGKFLNSLKRLLNPQVKFFYDNYNYKLLNTAGGLWTELRHSNVLYAKQSYSLLTLSLRRKLPTNVIVEPFIDIYKELKEITLSLNDIFPRDGILQFNQILDTLIVCSKEELKGKIPYQQNFLKKIPDIIEKLVGERPSIKVVDVHTDPNTGYVLEEAIGKPFILQVNVNIGGGVDEYFGGAYSYYEFKQPITDRLNDKEWEGLIDRYKPVDWIGRFVK